MIKKEILKNGTRVILIPNNSTGVISAMVMFGVGSRYENDKIAGISHLLEHMHYKGTGKRATAIDVAEFIESIGGEHNAFTSKEYTGYYVKVASRHLEKSYDFLSDILLNSRFQADELEREKSVVVEEIKMYEDSPMDMVGSKFEESLFGNNALGRDVIGFRESVLATTRGNLVDFRSRYYTGPNTVIVLSGNFNGLSDNELLALTEKYFTFSSSLTPDALPVTPQCERLHLVEKPTEQSHLVIGFQGAPFAHPDRYKLKILAVILGGSMSSRMFEEIREKRGLAYAVRCTTSSYSDAGTIETQVGVPHAKVIEAVKAVMNEYGKIRKEEVGERELRKAKEIIYGKLLISFEDSLDVASHHAISETLAGQSFTPEELMAIYEKITAQDILEVANKYFVSDRLSLAYIGPGVSREDTEKALTL
ncbi:MAG: Protease 3 precursor [bacterium ADurb.Bin400]|nr:MAG: Protease 3 precursor [bacterium ADurb.Bin400]